MLCLVGYKYVHLLFRKEEAKVKNIHNNFISGQIPFCGVVIERCLKIASLERVFHKNKLNEDLGFARRKRNNPLPREPYHNAIKPGKTSRLFRKNYRRNTGTFHRRVAWRLKNPFNLS